MSEEILKSLAQLFAIITKQDGGVTEEERTYVHNYFRKKLNLTTAQQYIALYEEHLKEGEQKEGEKKKLTSVKDSVRTLGICRKINKTLTQKQKIIVLIELLEILRYQAKSSSQQQEIIYTVADAFNIEKEEYTSINTFINGQEKDLFFQENVLYIGHAEPRDETKYTRHIYSELVEGKIYFLHIKSVDMYYIKYTGNDEVTVNGLLIPPGTVSLFSQGSTARTKLGAVFYYSDISAHFMSISSDTQLSFNVRNLEYRFPDHSIGLRDINISEGAGKLIGIMGASGAGKTTLLNVLAGLEKPYKGEVKINGIDIHKQRHKIIGATGYVPQDDLLIEELTVFENLFYNAKLCFRDKSNEELSALVNKTLESLALMHIKDLRVGSPLNKFISGGQRKRLNIALELIREPAILFVDEPTSGLSSKDSENVMDLLKELSLRGNLIFVVIHQPSSDIYKMFDKMYILDTGGYPIYYGNPIEAITYFKKITQQADSDKGQCLSCGNVNPEQIFNIIEEKVVDEYGQFTPHRKLTPAQWYEYFVKSFQLKTVEDLIGKGVRTMRAPGLLKQFVVFFIRDIKAKLNNRQYMLINTIEAPLLAFIMAFILRYKNNTGHSEYIYRFNENIPAFILMSIIIAIFIGLSVSAEEIIRDRKILRRESLLNLSRNSYLMAKVAIMFIFSAIQTATFVLVGNTLLQIKGLYLEYWLVLFTCSCFANVTGLLISSAFNTAITVYILVPLLVIPQLILSGAIFSFDKINDLIRSQDKVPLVADFIASRWAYEALAVKQYRDNEYQKRIFLSEKAENIANFNIVYLLPELSDRIEFIAQNHSSKNDSILKKAIEDLTLVKNEMLRQSKVKKEIDPAFIKTLDISTFTEKHAIQLNQYISLLQNWYNKVFQESTSKKEKILSVISDGDNQKLTQLKDMYFNESLSDLVRNATAKQRILQVKDYLVPKIEYIYYGPIHIEHALDYRAHFFSHVKHFAGKYFDTYYFNIIVLWIASVVLYLFLYFDFLRKFINSFARLQIKKM
ncbi:MAG: ATP-binding cassette domain-containing protein [Cytophagaceae bacterium]|nr:ATP-binding cassette domain-containing protein [Cytophagaceae bacterium]MDW8456193.1 ATP-binding cassette domain-containing protein [Cytophagaceae bacterium]